MSTILDALRKVERERESPRDRLHHEPEPSPKRGRRVSTVTIVICAVLGFAVGAGVALWREAEPVPEQVAVAVAPPPAIEVPAPPREPGTGAPESAAGAENPPPMAAGAAPADGAGTATSGSVPGAAGDGDDSAIEPSPFDPAPPVAGTDAASAEGDQVAALTGELPEDDWPAFEDEEALPEAEIEPEVDAAPRDEGEPAPAQENVVDTGRSPPGAPRVTLSFLQWSSDPGRRFAFISVDGAPSQRVREGDTAGGVSVDEITPGGVRLRHAESLFVIRPRH